MKWTRRATIPVAVLCLTALPALAQAQEAEEPEPLGFFIAGLFYCFAAR